MERKFEGRIGVEVVGGRGEDGDGGGGRVG